MHETKIAALERKHKAALKAAPAAAPTAPAAPAATVAAMRDEMSAANGKVQLLTAQLREAKEEQESQIRTSMAQEAEVSRLQQQLRDAAIKLSALEARHNEVLKELEEQGNAITRGKRDRSNSGESDGSTAKRAKPAADAAVADTATKQRTADAAAADAATKQHEVKPSA